LKDDQPGWHFLHLVLSVQRRLSWRPLSYQAKPAMSPRGTKRKPVGRIGAEGVMRRLGDA
jgi:hypothetical protein